MILSVECLMMERHEPGVFLWFQLAACCCNFYLGCYYVRWGLIFFTRFQCNHILYSCLQILLMGIHSNRFCLSAWKVLGLFCDKWRLQSPELTELLQLVIVLHYWQYFGIKLSVFFQCTWNYLSVAWRHFGQLVTEHWNNTYFMSCFYHIGVLPST